MPIDPKKLGAFLGKTLPPAGLPTPSEALYVRPNPDASRKNCGNCVQYVIAQGGRCAIHPASMSIPSEGICGYHVYGVPSPDFQPNEVMDPLDPVTSGFLIQEGGTSCDTCRFYSPRGMDGGICTALVTSPGGSEQAPVDAKGCCARWTALGGGGLSAPRAYPSYDQPLGTLPRR